MRRRTHIWLSILLIFFLLLLIIKGIIGQVPHYTQAPLILTTLVLIILFALYLATSRYKIWVIRPDHVLYMGIGTALTMGISYLFTAHLPIRFGNIHLQPAVGIPVLFGYAFGPGVGFFTGAVGSLLGDFAIGWDIFPTWNIAAGLTGLIPGFMALLKEENIPERYLSTVVVVLMGLSAGMVFYHPVVPEPWTGVMQDFGFWAYLLLIMGLIMFGNGYLMEQSNLTMIDINLWGALGILTSTLLASVADIWLNDFSPGTALIGEFAPYAAVDILNLVLFAPLLMAVYHAASRRLGIRVQRADRG
jgi:uncharacterized membrane protein